MKKVTLRAESLTVETFTPITQPESPQPTRPDPANCICFASPCICTNNVDCTGGTQ